MKKLTLTEAHKVLSNIGIANAFAAIVSDTVSKDSKKVQFYKDLKHKIYQAEKSVGITDIRHQVELLSIEAEYYSPNNSSFYYKDAITKEDIYEIKEHYNAILSDIEFLKNKIDEKGKQIFIEI